MNCCAFRPEGPSVNKPGRQAGKGVVNERSTEGAAQQRVSHLQRSSTPLNFTRPDGRAYWLAALWASMLPIHLLQATGTSFSVHILYSGYFLQGSFFCAETHLIFYWGPGLHTGDGCGFHTCL
jgi:hypothetical protein